MIENWIKFERVEIYLLGREEYVGYLGQFSDLSNPMVWRVLKSNKDFLEQAYQCTVAASGSSYATLSMQPRIFRLLRKLCEKTQDGSVSTGFTTPCVKKAASDMQDKSLKYEKFMCSMTNRIALILDPRTSNNTDDAKSLKDLLRAIISADYGYIPSRPVSSNEFDRQFDLFADSSGDEAACHDSDEIDDFFLTTSRPDKTCTDILQWWKMHTQRFPSLSQLGVIH